MAEFVRAGLIIAAGAIFIIWFGPIIAAGGAAIMRRLRSPQRAQRNH